METKQSIIEKGVIQQGGLLDDIQLLDAMALVSSYREFWNAKKFKENWDKPLCDLSKVEHLLEEAAEIVIEIRTKLGRDTSGDPIDGGAKEYLWSLESLPVEEEFVLELIHSTFLRGDGTYEASLTKESLDQLIAQVVHFNSTHQKGDSVEGPLVQLYREGSEIESKLLLKWKDTNELMKSLAHCEDVKLWTSSLIENLKAIDNSIDIVIHQLNHIKNRRDFKRTKSLNTLLNSRRSVRELKKKEVESKKKEQLNSPEKTEKTEKNEKIENENEKKDDETGKDSSESSIGEEIPVENLSSTQTPSQSQPSQPSAEVIKGLSVIENVRKGVQKADSEVKDLETCVKKIDEFKNKPKEAMNVITQMKKKAAVYLDALMSDLIKLDSLSGEGIRAERKKEITNIQAIMDSIEALQGKIHKFELEIQPAVAELEKKEAEEKLAKEKEEEEVRKRLIEQQRQKEAEQLRLKEEALRAREQNLKLSLNNSRNTAEDEDDSLALFQPNSEDSSVEQESPWRRLRLDVDLGVTEKQQAYVITGNVPGMRQKDIKIKVDDNKLIISGFREPTEIELQQMTRALTSRGFVPRNKNELIVALMKIGVGRFGTFQQTFQLPTDGSVDTSKIEAQYVHGMLKIVVPKAVRLSPLYTQKQPNYFNPYGQKYTVPQRRGFMHDPSVWW